MSFNAHISSSGATRQLDGQTAQGITAHLTMTANSSDTSSQKAGMAATSEMWLINDAPGLAEMRRFNVRLAKELDVDLECIGNVLSSGCPTRERASVAGAEEGIRQDGGFPGASNHACRDDGGRPAAAGAVRGASGAKARIMGPPPAP